MPCGSARKRERARGWWCTKGKGKKIASRRQRDESYEPLIHGKIGHEKLMRERPWGSAWETISSKLISTFIFGFKDLLFDSSLFLWSILKLMSSLLEVGSIGWWVLSGSPRLDSMDYSFIFCYLRTVTWQPPCVIFSGGQPSISCYLSHFLSFHLCFQSSDRFITLAIDSRNYFKGLSVTEWSARQIPKTWPLHPKENNFEDDSRELLHQWSVGVTRLLLENLFQPLP